MHLHHPQKPMKQATIHIAMHAQTTHTSQRNAFTAWLPSLHLSNHTHHNPYHTLYSTAQPIIPSTHTTINHDTSSPSNNHPYFLIHNHFNTYTPKHNTPRTTTNLNLHRNTEHATTHNQALSKSLYKYHIYDSTLSDSLVQHVRNEHFQLYTFHNHQHTHSFVIHTHTKLATLPVPLFTLYTRRWWLWLERCRDGSYAVKALRCDVWVVLVSVPDPLYTHKKNGRKVPEEGLVQLIQKASMGCSLYGLLWVR